MAELLNITNPQDLRDLRLSPDGVTGVIINDLVADVPTPYPTDPGVAAFELSTQYNRQEEIDVSYEDFSGNYICPRTYPEAAPEILNVHAPYSTRVVKFTVERVGAPPFIPSPVPTSYNEVLLYRKTIPAAPVIAPDGNRVYRVSGLYIFGITQAMPMPGPLPGSALSFDVFGPSLYGVSLGQFIPGLVSPPF